MIGSMIPRYQARYATEYFSDDARLAYWTQRTKGAALDLVNEFDLTSEDLGHLHHVKVDAGLVARYEVETGHEVVAFIRAFVEALPDVEGSRLRSTVHYAMTSSDLVEYSLHRAMTEHAYRMYVAQTNLVTSLGSFASLYDQTWRVGRTHGQIAEVTTLGNQFAALRTGAIAAMDTLHSAQQLVDTNKRMGPTGVSLLRQRPGVPSRASTQILHRNLMLAWANAYLEVAAACESIAQFIRLGCRADVREFEEGGAANRVGSSAMPAKRNPIGAENVVGLARLARGYHSALAEIPGSMWEDRDLSNSSTERVAVADLAHVVETMLTRTQRLLADLKVNKQEIVYNLEAAGDRAYMNLAQSLAMKHFNWSHTKANATISKTMEAQGSVLSLRQAAGDISDEAWLAFLQEFDDITDRILK